MYGRHSHALPGSQVGDCELGETGGRKSRQFRNLLICIDWKVNIEKIHDLIREDLGICGFLPEPLQNFHNQRIKDEKMGEEKDLRTVAMEIEAARVEPVSLFRKILGKGDAPGKV